MPPPLSDRRVADSPAVLSLRRVFALVLRHYYLYRSSWPRIIELVYWPTMQMALWGFITLFLITKSSWIAQAAGVLLSAVLLWDVLFRGQLGLSISFLEEMWSRNLGHLFVSPLRPGEFIAALILASLIRTVIGVGGAALLAFALFDYSILSLGLPLVAFFVNLIVLGWSVGLVVSGFVLRYGQGAESLAWAAIFLIQPVSGVYYPIDVLPEILQYAAAILPSAHIFEGMRGVVIDGVFDSDLLMRAMLLNVAYAVVGVASFLGHIRFARERGLILEVGE